MLKKFDIITPHHIPKLIKDLTRNVHTIVWHCTATNEGREVSAQEIEKWHKLRGFSEIGYNLGVNLDGSIVLCREWNKIPAHVAGFNTATLGFYYVGGVDKNGNPKDSRTLEQIDSMLAISEVCKDIFLIVKEKTIIFKGHRDFSPDKNGDGKIEEWEYTKACPSFDVKLEIVDKL